MLTSLSGKELHTVESLSERASAPNLQLVDVIEGKVVPQGKQTGPVT
jgi:hypothetical protein